MRCHKLVTDESGFMLIGTLLVLVAVTAIGVTLFTISNFEIDISKSERGKEEARYNSESCTIAGAKLIKWVAMEAQREGKLGIAEGDSRIAAVTYPDADGTDTSSGEALARKILSTDQSDTVCEDFTLKLAGTNIDAAANLSPMGTDSNLGTASNRQISGYGYTGLGGAAGGGFSSWFMVACRGDGCNGNGRHISYSRYKRVPGIPGGF
jgi:Tfp pilus assembly protein PilX